MIIKEANTEDIKKIAELYISNWKATYKAILPNEFLDRLDVAYGIEKWSAFLEAPDNHIFVAFDESQFLGFGAFTSDNEISDCLYIDSIHVCPDVRGKGIGTKLIRAIWEHAKRAGCAKMSICIVRGNDRARNLYCKLGAIHYSFFIDDFGGTCSNSEKLLWDDLNTLFSQTGSGKDDWYKEK